MAGVRKETPPLTKKDIKQFFIDCDCFLGCPFQEECDKLAEVANAGLCDFIYEHRKY